MSLYTIGNKVLANILPKDRDGGSVWLSKQLGSNDVYMVTVILCFRPTFSYQFWCQVKVAVFHLSHGTPHVYIHVHRPLPH